MASLPDPKVVQAALQRERDKFQSPTISDDAMGAILNAVALHFPNMGMHRKSGQAKQPGTGIGISHDVLRVMPPGDPLGFWSDVLGATGAGKATPLAPDWQRSSDGVESFVPPVAVGTIPKPDPTPTPVPSGPSLHDWTIIEWPQVRDARRAALHDPEWDPDPEWVILQMARRYGLGLAPGEKPWTLQQMIDHERAQ